MTYGVYSRDLKGQSISGVSLNDAKKYCHGDKVVCSEKDVTNGFAVRIVFSKSWDFRIRPFWQYANLGFARLSWEWLRYKCADKIVWEKPQEGDAK